MTSNDVFLGGGSNSGSIINAELPNIKGKLYTPKKRGWSFYDNNSATYEGAIEAINDGEVASAYGTAGWTNLNGFLFNASLYNSIYKDNGKLIPKHYVIEFWIKFK